MFRTFIKNSVRNFTRLQSTMPVKSFESAVSTLPTLKQEPDNITKLKIYALFKQASVGECNVAKPGMTNFVGKAKWSAWKELGSMSQSDAKDTYVDLINALISAEAAPSSSPPSPSEGDLITEVDGRITKIILNRPDKKNALKREMYLDIEAALREAASNDTTLAVITGRGTHYSSGNDLSNFTSIDLNNMQEECAKGADLLKSFVASLIDFPKPLVALVNGPSIGISVTTLGLFDAVYASDKATFQTPFSSLGQSPEGCSTYTFPIIMGPALATEMLMFNRKLTAQQAKDAGLVSEIFPSTSFEQEAWSRVKELSMLPPLSLRASKRLCREVVQDTLHRVNERECLELRDRWQSDECKTAVFNFFKSKM